MSSHTRAQTEFSSNPTPEGQHHLTVLRADAFWQLHKSVEESGEGLVRRMREYEHSRARAGAYSKARDAHKRGRKRSSVQQVTRKVATLVDESDASDDDVEIMGGDIPSVFWVGGHRLKRRASSMDTDPPHPDTRSQSLPDHGRCPSPSPWTGSSPCISEDEVSNHLPVSTNTPSSTRTLSQTASDSPNSSIVSLTLSQEHDYACLDTPTPSLPTSRSEKALAALSLAMANGAGSLDDYNSLVMLQQHSALDESHAGEMWH